MCAADEANKQGDTDEPEKIRIQALVEELDRLVPRTEAVVLLTQYGGCDESQITATETGYLRLGIEVLKPAVAPPLADSSGQLDVDWEYLVSEHPDVFFHTFHLNNSLHPDTPYFPKELLAVTADLERQNVFRCRHPAHFTVGASPCRGSYHYVAVDLEVK